MKTGNGLLLDHASHVDFDEYKLAFEPLHNENYVRFLLSRSRRVE